MHLRIVLLFSTPNSKVAMAVIGPPLSFSYIPLWGSLCSDPSRVQRACGRAGSASSCKEVDDYLFSCGRLPMTQPSKDQYSTFPIEDRNVSGLKRYDPCPSLGLSG